MFYKLLDEARKEYEKHYEDLFNKKILLEVEKTEKEIKTKTINRLYDDLYSGIQYEVSKKYNLLSLVWQIILSVTM